MPEYPRLENEAPTDERGDWRVVAAMHRDSRALDRSNYDEARALLAEIDAAGIYELRARNWAHGWIDYLTINPASPALMAEADRIADALASYPVLSDDRYSDYDHAENHPTPDVCYDSNHGRASQQHHRSSPPPLPR